MQEGTARPEPLLEVAMHNHLHTMEEARVAAHILHQGRTHHSQEGLGLPQPDTPQASPDSWGWSRAGHGHCTMGQGGVCPLTIPAPARPHVPAPGHRSPAPSTMLLQLGG